MLELKNISFKIDDENREKEILKNINIKFDNKKFIVITGPNGSGKSTLVKLIAGADGTYFITRDLRVFRHFLFVFNGLQRYKNDRSCGRKMENVNFILYFQGDKFLWSPNSSFINDNLTNMHYTNNHLCIFKN